MSWPEACELKNHESEQLHMLSNKFNEAATQSAFMAIALRLQRHEEHLETLTRRTDVLSPSRQRRIVPHSTPTALPCRPPSTHTCSHCAFCSNDTSRRGASTAHDDRRIDQPLPSLISTIEAATRANANDAGSSPSSPVAPTSSLQSPVISRQPLPATASFNSSSHSDVPQIISPAVAPAAGPPVAILTPVTVTVLNKTYTVLPLSPGPTPLRTNADLILPASVAFTDLKDSSVPRYPTFTARSCNWTSVLSMVRQPQHLWTCWGPGSLGEYDTIEALWEAWDVGRTVPGVGQKPPLRLIEEEWGEKKKTATQKGRQQVWRPKGNNTVRTHVLSLLSLSTDPITDNVRISDPPAVVHLRVFHIADHRSHSQREEDVGGRRPL